MKSTHFAEGVDLEPIPFTAKHCRMAKAMRERGLPWEPHVGCFVWDEQRRIGVPSPFPHDVYFILNLGRFLQIFGTPDRLKESLIWLPTWHQARLLCEKYGVGSSALRRALVDSGTIAPGQDVLALYALILECL